ncbi:MAG: urease accessory protein UreF [Deltaproteobacteria bacterium]|nr:urease accessory protein UreF [Deltaproteobacteria bacterium]
MNGHADIRLLRLLQLASPALPVGAYSYSQGLEAAIAAGIVTDAATTKRWIGDVLEYSLGRLEAPLLLRLIAAWQANDFAAVNRWNDLFLAGRETAELRAETVQMGFSLTRLFGELGDLEPRALGHLRSLAETAFPTGFGMAVAHWQIAAQEALAAYLWGWLENQIMAAIKTVPLGQTQGQQILLALSDHVVRVTETAAQLSDDELGGFMPQLAILSSRHETQYTRLFRS